MKSEGNYCWKPQKTWKLVQNIRTHYSYYWHAFLNTFFLKKMQESFNMPLKMSYECKCNLYWFRLLLNWQRSGKSIQLSLLGMILSRGVAGNPSSSCYRDPEVGSTANYFMTTDFHQNKASIHFTVTPAFQWAGGKTMGQGCEFHPYGSNRRV